MDIHHPACLIGYKQENFENIEAFKHLSGKKTLALFFSAATNDLKDYCDFLGYLKNNFDVIFVDDGYYGLCDDGKDINESYSSDVFVGRFYDHFKNIVTQYSQIALIGQSMGTVIAKKLFPKIPQAKMVLTSPPWSEGAYRFDAMDRALIEMVLHSNFGRELEKEKSTDGRVALVYRLVGLIPENSGLALKRDNLGSLVHCLEDVHINGIVDPEKIPADWLMFIGKDDYWLGDFCLQEKIKKRPNTFLINCGHGVLQKNWPEVIAKVKQIYPELFPADTDTSKASKAYAYV